MFCMDSDKLHQTKNPDRAQVNSLEYISHVLGHYKQDWWARLVIFHSVRSCAFLEQSDLCVAASVIKGDTSDGLFSNSLKCKSQNTAR